MSQQISLTLAEMQEVFQMWNDDYLVNPDGYDEISSDESCAAAQTKHFNKLLNALRSQ